MLHSCCRSIIARRTDRSVYAGSAPVLSKLLTREDKRAAVPVAGRTGKAGKSGSSGCRQRRRKFSVLLIE